MHGILPENVFFHIFNNITFDFYIFIVVKAGVGGTKVSKHPVDIKQRSTEDRVEGTKFKVMLQYRGVVTDQFIKKMKENGFM